MKLTACLLLSAGLAAAIPLGCSDSDSGSEVAPWSATGGSAGSLPDSGTAGADASSAGSAGSAHGGNSGDASADATDCAVCEDGSSGCDANLPVPEAGKDAGFWNGTDYGAQCPPNPSDGYHSAGQDCMFCHNGSISPSFVFGGTIYKPDHVEGAPGVEIGVSTPTGLFVGCSASNGNFWVWGPPDIDWAQAEIRMRNSKGQSIMKSTGAAACNSCHLSSPLVAP